MGPLMEVAIGIGVLVVLAWVRTWLMRRDARRAVLALEARTAAHPRNAGFLQNIAALEPSDRDTNTRLLAPWTRRDDAHARRTLGQLEAPGMALFPLIGEKLGPGCVWKLRGWPALVRPDTGVILGIRVGTYLSLLRVDDPERERALAEGIVWPRCPLPALRHHDLASLLGPEWVVPNLLHAEIDAILEAAYLQAGA